MVEATGCGCPVDTSVHSTEAPTEAAAETLNLRPCASKADVICLQKKSSNPQVTAKMVERVEMNPNLQLKNYSLF